MSVVVGAVIIVLLYLYVIAPLFQWYKKRAKFIEIIEKIPGPKAYPIIGTTYLDFFTPRGGMYTLNLN